MGTANEEAAAAAIVVDEQTPPTKRLKLVSKSKAKTKTRAKQGPRHCKVCGKKDHDKRNCPEASKSKSTSLAIVPRSIVKASPGGLVTVKEAAKIAGVSDSNLYFWMKDKRVLSVKQGYNRLIERKSLMKYLATYKGNPMAKVVQLRRRAPSEERKAQILRLHKDGKSYSEISEQLGVSSSLVGYHVNGNTRAKGAGAYRDDEHRASSEKNADGSSRLVPPRETLSPNRRVELALRNMLDHILDLDTEERRMVLRGLNTLINFTAAPSPTPAPRARISSGAPKARQRCSYCGRLGHKRPACPSARRCTQCNKTGHDKRNCPDFVTT